MELHYPVISVDSSRIKRVEDALGSADGFIRALRSLLPDESLEGRKYVLFGYGKVGLGISLRLSKVNN